jgi:hypothetical protein
MNNDHKKSILGLLFSLTMPFSGSVLFSNTVQAHPDFDPLYSPQHNDQYNHQSVGYRTESSASHSPFMAYPETIYPWELADNHKNHHKHDRKRFDELSPAQKERIKKRREAFKSLPPEEKERIYRAREEFHNMPPEKRQRLKEKWRNMSPEERERSHKRRHREEGNK